MKRTIFIIKDEDQEPEDFPPFLQKFEDQKHIQILFLRKGNKSLAKWLQIRNLMVVGESPDNINSQDGTTFQFLSYQDFLEKIFEVDVPLVF